MGSGGVAVFPSSIRQKDATAEMNQHAGEDGADEKRRDVPEPGSRPEQGGAGLNGGASRFEYATIAS
jgi:hypothetical protein